jgi:hypothetical protein
MNSVTNYPLAVFAISFALLAFSAWIGLAWRRLRQPLEDASHEDFGVVQAATLTLLGLIIGFTFSMAVNRHDQRKNLEEAEANAIGTEYLRADLLPAADAAKLRTLLKSYLEQRLLFYDSRDAQQIAAINAETARLQEELWSAVRTPATALPTPISAIVVVGMNDVLNSQGYTQAAWWNRIPIAAWVLMVAIAMCANLPVGVGAKSGRSRTVLIFVLPFVVSISFLLIADIDSPRGGLIRMIPQNLRSFSESLRAPQ